jgi:hypothetical protein
MKKLLSLSAILLLSACNEQGGNSYQPVNSIGVSVTQESANVYKLTSVAPEGSSPQYAEEMAKQKAAQICNGGKFNLQVTKADSLISYDYPLQPNIINNNSYKNSLPVEKRLPFVNANLSCL